MSDLVFKGNEEQVLTSSLLVAEKFGKFHKDVVEIIRNLLSAENSAQTDNKQFSKMNVSAENSVETINQKLSKMFALADYDVQLNNGTGATRKAPMYVMNRDGFILLVMGFSGDKALQFKLEYMEAFNEMEKKLKDELVLFKSKPMSDNTLYSIRMKAASWAVKFMNLDDVAKLNLVKAVMDPLGLPSPIYADSEGAIHSASYLLKSSNADLSIREFNIKMEKAGLLKHMERPSRSKGSSKYWNLTKAGLAYGVNKQHPKNDRETQPCYFDAKFGDLLKYLHINNKTYAL